MSRCAASICVIPSPPSVGHVGRGGRCKGAPPRCNVHEQFKYPINWYHTFVWRKRTSSVSATCFYNLTIETSTPKAYSRKGFRVRCFRASCKLLLLHGLRAKWKHDFMLQVCGAMCPTYASMQPYEYVQLSSFSKWHRHHPYTQKRGRKWFGCIGSIRFPQREEGWSI